jgi:16S rRNA (guanine527-N7)-methyltransferase
MASAEDELRAGLGSLGLALADAQIQQLLDFAGLLQKWTRVYNLTALRRPEEVLTHHILDSAAVIEPLRRMCPGAKRILDVGAGGGLPGTIIAIAGPEFSVDCVDTVAKKTAFIQQVATTLRLPNLRAIHSRVEQLQDGGYDIICSRAFATLGDFVGLSGAALKKGGIWLAMKGKYPADEVAALPPDVELFHVEQLHVPGLNAERCLIWLRRRTG